MKRTIKKIVSVVLCSAMVLTSVNVSSVKVSAATLEEMVADEQYNLAKGKNAIAYPGVAEGKLENINNGAFGGGGAHCALSSGWGYLGESYAVIDLGDAYDASTIDQIVVQYKDAADNDTVISRSYKIQYSIDGVDYRDVVAETYVDALDENRCIIDDVSEVEGVVKYVKVYYPTTANYGIQITEIAVLDTDLNAAKVEMEKCDDPAGVTVSSEMSSDVKGEIAFNITAGEGQDGYTYSVYLDSSSTPAMTGCVAGTDYVIKGVDSGVHTIKVVSNYNGMVSEGIVSEEVVVSTIVDSVTDGTKNLAYGKDFVLSSGNSTEGNGSLTDGVISNGSYVTSTKGEAGAFYTIDLGMEYTTSGIDSVYVWFRSNVGGTYPENGRGYEVRYAGEDGDFVSVVEVKGVNTILAEQSNAQPFVVTSDVSQVFDISAVRYVQIYFPEGVAYGAQLTEVAVFDTNGDATEAAPGVNVEVPAGVTAESNAYNTITAIVMGAEGYDYTYEVTVNGETKSALAGETVTFTGVPAGTYTVTAKSVDAEGNKSKAVESEPVVVEDSFVYTRTNSVNELFPDSNDNGNNYIRYEGVSGSASTGNADAALDNNAGSRWESASTDPQSITVNLGSVMNIKEVSMTWEAANAKTYTVEASSDGVQWTTVAMISNQAEGSRLDEIVFKSEIAAQYIKINGTARNLTYGYSIWEIAIYGPDAAPTVEVEAPEIKGFQMNTSVDGVSAKSPSFRVMTEMPENAELGTYGTVYALASNVNSVDIEAGQDNVYTHVATAAGTVSYAGVEYYALTFTNNGTSAEAMKTEYIVRSYVVDNGEYKYGEAYTVSIYDIAKTLYDGRMTSNEVAHNYLYNNVLNIVAIHEGKVDAVKALFTELGVASTEDPLYAGCGQAVYSALSDYVANGYVVGAGRNGEPTFNIATELVAEVEGKLGMTVEAWMEANLYYGKVAAPSNLVR